MGHPSKPAVSVLISLRNAAGTLDQALGSLAAQTFRDWEAVVVDDASTDDTRRLLAAWRRRDERFRILRNDDPLGEAASFCRALEAAEAPLVAGMEAGSVSLPRRLERQVERVAAGDVTAVGCGLRCLGAGELPKAVQEEQDRLNALLTPEQHDRDLLLGCPVPPGSLLADAEAVRKVGGFGSDVAPHGEDLPLRLHEAGYRVARVPECLFLWRGCPGDPAAPPKACGGPALLEAKIAFLLRTHLRDGRPAVVFGAGPAGRAVAAALRRAGGDLHGYADIDPSGRPGPFGGLPLLTLEEALELRSEAFGLLAVDDPSLREAFRTELLRQGWRELAQFRCIA